MIDLNCDLGESFGVYQLGADDQLLPLVSSVNIACGGHAGDPLIMTKTVRAALKHGVAIGAHPGYLDLYGFGRRPMQYSPEELRSILLYQIGALQAIVAAEGGSLHHVKPHGSLYNLAMVDETTAEVVAAAIADFDKGLYVYTQPESALERACHRYGLHTVAETFADRRYNENGRLVDRTLPGALLSMEEAVKQAVELASGSPITAANGEQVAIRAETICIHGDHSDAVVLTQQIREAFAQARIAVRAPQQTALGA